MKASEMRLYLVAISMSFLVAATTYGQTNHYSVGSGSQTAHLYLQFNEIGVTDYIFNVSFDGDLTSIDMLDLLATEPGLGFSYSLLYNKNNDPYIGTIEFNDVFQVDSGDWNEYWRYWTTSDIDNGPWESEPPYNFMQDLETRYHANGTWDAWVFGDENDVPPLGLAPEPSMLAIFALATLPALRRRRQVS